MRRRHPAQRVERRGRATAGPDVRGPRAAARDGAGADVSRFHPKRQGDGVALERSSSECGRGREANYLTLHADRDDFHVSVRCRPSGARAIVVYQLGDQRARRRARRADPVPDPRPGRLPHRRARRLRQRQVPQPDRADRPARPRHPARRRGRASSRRCTQRRLA